MRPRIILHIGLERTGTTSLQQFCLDHKRQLRDASILYPTKTLAFARINHAPLASCYFSHQSPDFTVVAPPAAKSAVLASLFREIESEGAEVALLSAEHFSSRLKGPQVLDLAADLAAYDCRVAVVVRDHMSRFFSSYSNHVVSGGATSLEAYADNVLAPESFCCRYAETIGLWEKAFGRQNVQAFAYDRRGDVLQSVLERFAPRTPSASSVVSYRQNQLYGPVVTEAFRRANAMTAAQKSWSNTAANWERRRMVRILMQRWIAKAPIDPSAGQWSLMGDRLERLKAIAESDRRWLSERYGLLLSEEAGRTSAAGAPTELWVQAFVKRAALNWRLLGAAEPFFKLALDLTAAWRLLRHKVKV